MRTILYIWYTLLLVSGLIGSAGIYAFISLPPSSTTEEFHAVWIPENAVVINKNSVHPGTFKIDLSLEDLQKTTQPNQKVYVVYAEYSSNGNPGITYWRSEGDGVFATTTVSFPSRTLSGDWDTIDVIRTVRFDQERGGFAYTNPMKDWDDVILPIFPALGFLFLRFLVWTTPSKH